MEKKSALLPTILAIAAAFLYLMFLSAKERELSSAYQTVTVLAAAVDIPARTVLKSGLVETIAMPRKFMQQDAIEIRSPADVKLINNLVTRIRIPRGNQIAQSALVALSPESGLSVKVPPGYRADTLDINAELEPLIKPGDHVDALVTFKAKVAGGGSEEVTATILQNIMVLAVGENLGGASPKKKKAGGLGGGVSQQARIAVAVNPMEAQYLELSKQTGTVSIILRGLGDMEMHPMEMASFSKLFK